MDNEKINSVEEELCPLCGKNALPEGEDYCNECKENMIKRKIPFGGWVAVAVALLFMCVSSVWIMLLSGAIPVTVIDETTGIEENISTNVIADVIIAESDAETGNWQGMFEKYYNAYAGINNINIALNNKLGTDAVRYIRMTSLEKGIADSVSNYYSPIDAYYLAVTLFDEGAVTEKHMKKYSDAFNKHDETYNAISQVLMQTTQTNANEEKILSDLEEFRGKEGIHDQFLDYYIYAAAYQLGADSDKQIELIKNIEKSCIATGEDYDWFYKPIMAQTLFEAGEYEEALEYATEVVADNKPDYNMNRLKMRLHLILGDKKAAERTVKDYRKLIETNEFTYYADILEIEYLRCIGDFKKARALCEEARHSYEVVSQTTSPVMDLVYFVEGYLITATEIDRQDAIMSLLDGDYASAFSKMMSAYQTESYYASYTSYSAALNEPAFYGMLYLTSNLIVSSEDVPEDTLADAEYIVTMFSDENGLPEDAVAIVKGEKTIDEVFAKGEFDLA